MKIASWNINSVRARLPRFIEYLEKGRPDVLCVQELKCQEHEFPTEEVQAAGYLAALHGQKTYNGVAILTRQELGPATEVVKGLSDDEDDAHARLIAGTVGGIRILSVYAPNGQEVGSEAYVYKLRWYQRLRRYLDTRQRKDQPLIVTGDFNVAPSPIDVHDPGLWEGQTLCSQPEREALAELMAFGLTDTYRLKNPETQAFSWWDYRQLSFPKNKGLRIDHVLVSAPLLPRLTEAGIEREFRKGKQPSDHAPVFVQLGPSLD
ncbi:MAG: exodeoxyribonuclease III [Myxococcota bacterium]|nr:exodeoxyribonuclease III [Myxococcota bacterium]